MEREKYVSLNAQHSVRTRVCVCSKRTCRRRVYEYREAASAIQDLVDARDFRLRAALLVVVEVAGVCARMTLDVTLNLLPAALGHKRCELIALDEQTSRAVLVELVGAHSELLEVVAEQADGVLEHHILKAFAPLVVKEHICAARTEQNRIEQKRMPRTRRRVSRNNETGETRGEETRGE